MRARGSSARQNQRTVKKKMATRRQTGKKTGNPGSPPRRSDVACAEPGVGGSSPPSDTTEYKQAEAALRESEERFRTVVANAAEGINMLDLATGRYVFLSPRQVEMTGFTENELRGLSAEEVLDRVHPDDRRMSLEHQRAVAAGKVGTMRVEYRWKIKSGEFRWFSDSRSLVRDAQGRPVALVGVSLDITDQKRAEYALRESEEKLALAANGTQIGIFDRNLATGEIVATEQHVRLLGLRPTMTTATATTLSQRYHYRDWAKRVHPGDLPRVEAEMERSLAQGTPYETEYRVTWPNGSEHWVAVRGVFRRGTSGAPDRLLGVMMDITAHKRTERALSQLNATLEQRIAERTAALRESEARFHKIFDSTLDGMLLKELKGSRFYMANKACLNMLGYGMEEFTSLKLANLHFKEDLPSIRREIEKFSRGRSVRRFEVRFRRKDGSFFFSELSPTVIRLKGKDYMLVTIRDVSEHKRLEAEIQKVSENERQRIGRDLHDGLGQTLTAVRYMASAVHAELARKSSPEAPELAKIVGQIQHAMRQSHEVARGLFPDEFRMGGILPALQELAVSTSDLFQVQCRFSGPNECIVSDANVLRHLYRIAQEAANNAIKHSRGKRIWIRLEQNRLGTTLSVRDNGTGIRKRTLKQTDMGLHIMRYRADMIGATLSIKSARGRGTKVECFLPANGHRGDEAAKRRKATP